MRRSIWPLALGAVLAFGSLGHAADAANSQQAKMTSCNADAKAKGLQGADRKAFMKSCLSADSGSQSAPANSQQAKMKTCNADAKTKGLKGDDRKKFMSQCLKSAPATP
jgi:hypothetical protein